MPGSAALFDDHLNDTGHVVGPATNDIIHKRLTGNCTCPLACSSLHGHLFAVNWLLRVVRGVCDHREFLVELLAEPWGIRRHSGAYIPGPESMFDQLSKCSLWRCCWRRTSNFELITTLCLLCIVVVQYLYIPIELMF